MNFTKEQVEEVIEFLSDVNEYKPLVKIVIDILEEYGTEFKRLPDSFIKYSNEKTVESFKYFISNGFTRQEALLLVTDSKASLRKLLNDMNTNKKR